jgi:hypothetical protein
MATPSLSVTRPGARTTWEAMRPCTKGVYVNFMSDEPATHARIAYGDHKYGLLAALKSKYDPSNVSRFNQTSRQPTEPDENRQLRADDRQMAYRRPLRVGVRDVVVKINEIHGGDHVTDQGDLSNFRFATHGSRNRDGTGLPSELGLPGVEQAGREEPAANSNVSPTLAAQSADRLSRRGTGAGCKGRYAGQPVMGRPLPGSSRDERVAPDIGAAGGREHQPVQL